MTDETYERIKSYLRDRGCLRTDVLNLPAPIVVDEDLEIDAPIMPAPPAPPEVRVCPSDYEDLRRRVDMEPVQ